MPTRASHHQGLTLIEIIVSIGIIALISGGVIAVERGLIINTKVLQSELISQQQVRKTLGEFVRDVRAASQSAAGWSSIESAATNTLVFYANVDNDPAVERIRYFIATTTLMRGVIKPTGTAYLTANEMISSSVFDVQNGTSTPVFTYFDTGYDGFTSSSSDPLPVPINLPLIRMIKMSLTVNPNGVRSPVMQTYTTQVSIRNLKDNL